MYPESLRSLTSHDLVCCLSMPWHLEMLGLPWWLCGKEPACQCRKCRRLWVRSLGQDNPLRRKWQTAPVFLCLLGAREGSAGAPGLTAGVVKDGNQCRDTPASDSLQGTVGSSSEDLRAEDHSPHRTLPANHPSSASLFPPLLPGIPPK